MALRSIGKRSPALNTAAVKVVRRLVARKQSCAALGGNGRAAELTSPAVTRRLADYA